MTLNDLEFKAEDFYEYCIKNPGAPHAECIAEHANRLLRERLGKAPVVYMDAKYSEGIWFEPKNPMGRVDTHTARLVGVEEIKADR